MDNDKMLRDKEVKHKTGLSRTTRWRLEQKGEFPKRRLISSRLVAWRLSEIDEWLSTRAQVVGIPPEIPH